MQLQEKQFEAVIFDLDGTLLDSMWMWKQIDIDFLTKYGHPMPEDLQKDIEGMGFSELAVYFKKRFSLPISLEEIKAEWNAMALDFYRTKTPLKPGARAFLDSLQERGIPMGIATSNSRELAEAALSGNRMTGYFRSVTTACEVKAGKPAPDIYWKVAADLGVAPEKCLVFEDVPTGARAGKAAGMTVVGVEDAYCLGAPGEMEQICDEYVRDFTEWKERYGSTVFAG